MTRMTIRIVNATFESVSENEYESVDHAYRAGVLAGLDIATAEVANGSDASIVHIVIDRGGERGVARGAVSVSTARLLGEASA